MKSPISGISKFFKIVIIGDSGVGKTALIQRLTDNKFSETSATVGVQYQPYICPLSSNKNNNSGQNSNDTDDAVQLQIWDTAGQEKYKSISKAYFRNAVGAVLVFDITDINTFENASMWLQELRESCNQNAFILLVGNKKDRESEREVGEEAAREFARQQMIEYREASALNGDNVKETFARLAFAISEKTKQGIIQINQQKQKESIEQNEINDEKKEKKCKC